MSVSETSQPFESSEPPAVATSHFVRDYRNLTKGLIEAVGHEKAMHQGVGGEYEGIGKIEAALMTHLGLAEGHFVVDVGCGSGRLAAALSRGRKIAYHGTDVVPEFLDYARAHSAEDFRFSLVDGLSIPEADSVADFVTFFSVVTHLMLHETYTYLLEATRVVKAGGLIVLSFLDPSNIWHWETLLRTATEARAGRLVHLNAFIEPKTMKTLADRLGLEVQAIHNTGTRFIPVTEPIALSWGGMVREGTTNYAPGDLCELGQSIAVLRKPLFPSAF